MVWTYKDQVNSWIDLVMVNKPKTRMFGKVQKDHEDEQFDEVEIANMFERTRKINIVIRCIKLLSKQQIVDKDCDDIDDLCEFKKIGQEDGDLDKEENKSMMTRWS